MPWISELTFLFNGNFCRGQAEKKWTMDIGHVYMLWPLFQAGIQPEEAPGDPDPGPG